MLEIDGMLMPATGGGGKSGARCGGGAAVGMLGRVVLGGQSGGRSNESADRVGRGLECAGVGMFVGNTGAELDGAACGHALGFGARPVTRFAKPGSGIGYDPDGGPDDGAGVGDPADGTDCGGVVDGPPKSDGLSLEMAICMGPGFGRGALSSVIAPFVG
jgi:hypothetical protein